MDIIHMKIEARTVFLWYVLFGDVRNTHNVIELTGMRNDIGKK